MQLNDSGPSAPLTDARTFQQQRGGRTVPPALPMRLLLLCVRPEQWAEAARYPFRATVTPVVLAILIAASVMAVANGQRVLAQARRFAAGYDQHHPSMILRDGRLTLAPGADVSKHGPIWVIEQMPCYGTPLMVAVDPTRQTHADQISYERALLITDSEMIIKGQRSLGGGEYIQSDKLAGQSLVPGEAVRALQKALGQEGMIDSAHLNEALDRQGWALAGGVGIATFGYYVLKELIWAAVMTILVAPLVSFGAPGMAIPKRITYRVAAAVQVPLILLGAGLDLAGYSPAQALPADWAVVFWGFTAAALALWSGILLHLGYQAQRVRRGT